MDLLIHETGSNTMVNPNNYYIGDIKTGKTKRGSTYGTAQMAKNQGNLRNQSITTRAPIAGVTHWQFTPGNVSPTERIF